MLPNEVLRRQENILFDRAFTYHQNYKRYSSIFLSTDPPFHSKHRAAVLWLDLEQAEHRYLLSCAADGSISIFDTQPLSAPSSTATTRDPVVTINRSTPHSHSSPVSTVSWYPVDAGLFVSGSRDGLVKLWDANSLLPAHSFTISQPVHCAMMSPLAVSHCLIAVGSADVDVVLCDVVSGGFTHRLSGHRAEVWAACWSVENEWELLTGGRDGQIRVWDIRRAGCRQVLDMHTSLTTISHRKAKGRRQLTTQIDNVASHAAGITGLIPTPDGLYYLSAGSDDKLRLWESSPAYTHQLVHYPDTFNRATKPRQLAVSEDGKAVFFPSGSAVAVFDVESGRALGVLSGGHFESVNACVWNGEKGELYTGSNDHSVVCWAPRVRGGDVLDADGEMEDKDAWSD